MTTFRKVLTLLLLCSTSAFAQQDSSRHSGPARHQPPPPPVPFRKKIQYHNHHRDPSDLSGKCMVKLTASSLLDPMGVTLPLCAEYFFNDKNSLQVALGVPLLHSYNVSTQVTSDLLGRLEYRNYMRIHAVTRNFMGVEIWGRRQEFVVDERWSATKTVAGIGVFFGRTYKVVSNFYIDWKVGFGNMYYWSNNYIHNLSPYEYVQPSYTYFDQDRLEKGFGKYAILGVNFAYAF